MMDKAQQRFIASYYSDTPIRFIKSILHTHIDIHGEYIGPNLYKHIERVLCDKNIGKNYDSMTIVHIYTFCIECCIIENNRIIYEVKFECDAIESCP